MGNYNSDDILIHYGVKGMKKLIENIFDSWVKENKKKSLSSLRQGLLFFRPEYIPYYRREDADGARSEHRKDKL